MAAAGCNCFLTYEIHMGQQEIFIITSMTGNTSASVSHWSLGNSPSLSLCWAGEQDAIACLCCISLSSSWMLDHFLYQKQKAKLAPQSSCWALCNWKWLNSLTVEHQRWNASLSGLVFPPPYFIYGQFGNLGLAHLFLALFILISLFSLIAPADVPEPLMG